DRCAGGGGGTTDRLAAGQGPEDEHVGLAAALGTVEAGERRNESAAAGGQHQAMVASLPAALDDDHPANQVDGAHAGSAAQPDFMFFVPTGRVERDVARAVLAGENAREEDPVVAGEGLVAVDLHGATEPRAGHARL